MRTHFARFAATLLFAGVLLDAAGQPRDKAKEHGAAISVLTDDVALVLDIRDFSKLRDQLRQSAVGQAVMNTPVMRSTLDFLAAAGDLAAYVFAEQPGAELKACAPTRWTLAVFQLPVDAGDLDPPAIAFVGELTAASSGFPTMCTERLLPGFATMFGEWQLSTQEHQGTTVHHLSNPKDGSDVRVAFLERFVVFGNDVGVKKLISCVQKPGRLLIESDRYLQAVENADTAALATSYLDLAPGLAAKLDEMPEGSKPLRDMRFIGVPALRTIDAAVAAADARFGETIHFTLADDVQGGLLGLLGSRQPVNMRSATVVPPGADVHVSLSITDGRDLFSAFEELAREAHGDEAAMKFVEVSDFFQNSFNIDLEGEVLSRLGPELFFALDMSEPEKVIAQKRKPRWSDFEILFGVEVREPDAVEHALQSFVANPALVEQGMSLTTVAFEGVEVRVLRHPKLPNGAINYTILGDFMVFSLNRKSLAQASKAVASEQTLAAAPRYRLNKGVLAKPVMVSAFADARPVIPLLLPQLLQAKAPKVRVFIAGITDALTAAGEIQLTVSGADGGLVLESSSPLPAGTFVLSAAALDRVGKSRVGRRAKDAEEGMKKVGKALRKYHRRNQRPPDYLEQLVPTCIDALPTDPFQQNDNFKYAVSSDGSGWLLLSLGPDGVQDLNTDGYDAKEWQAFTQSWDSDTMAEAKTVLYRFRHKKLQDERAGDDEGDIVRTGRWR